MGKDECAWVVWVAVAPTDETAGAKRYGSEGERGEIGVGATTRDDAKRGVVAGNCGGIGVGKELGSEGGIG